ncbi:MAG: winged helix-turn-helix transcriptional regulator [Methanobacteriota archaeon]|nr:MAG: winged helix-turn-helix transcriptional regulator [Euryarchaeota archaeon]
MVRDSIPWLGSREMRIELDKKSLFALASDTRLEMLKSLQPKRRTVSQLSEELGIDKGAIHRHLKKMEEGGLVKRYEDHGFVYYGLSWKARDLMTPNENTRIIIVLSAMWIFSVVAVFFLAAGIIAQTGPDPLSDAPRSPAGEYDSAFNETLADNSLEGQISWTAPIAVFSSIALVLFIVAFRLIRKPLQDDPEKAKGLDLPNQVDPDG